MRKRYLLLALSVAVILSLLVTPLTFADPPTSYANKQARYRKITVVSTNDFHGALVGRVHSWSHGDAVGGAEWLAGYLNIVREENPRGFLYLDAGDIMQGTLISNYFDGASTIEAFNAMGLDAMAIGNHEFDWGQDVLWARDHQADFPFLAANVLLEKKYGKPGHGHGRRPRWAKPYVVRKVNGVKVGIIGLANPETPSITNPVNVEGLVFTDGVAEANRIARFLERRRKVRFIIVLAHIGGYWPDFGEVGDLACSLDAGKVDLIVSGHTHGRLDDEICGIPVVQAYSSGTAFSRVDFTVDKRSGEVVDYEMNYSPTTTYQTYYGDPAEYKRWDTGQWQQVVPDPEVEAIVDYYEAQIEDIKNEVIGCANSDITRNYRYESEMGDWVTDIMRAYDPSIDFALTNSGGLRADIDAGDITFGEVFEAQPFDNTLVVVELTGAQLIETLEDGITGDHGVVQVSGLKFAFDYGAEPPGDSVIVGDVYDTTGTVPVVIDPVATYYVAVNDFMAAGGDDYHVLPGAPQTNTYVLVRDIVVDWVKAAGCFDPPDPALEQRMTITGTPPS